MDATLKAALQADAPTIFYALEMLLPSSVNIRLLDGPGSLTLFGNAFTGRDATYGVLGGIQSVTDGMGDEAPHLTFEIHPPSNAAAATLAAQAAQGSAVSLWMGAINASTGAVLGTPDLVFAGQVDVPTLMVAEGARSVSIECASIFERFFEGDEGLEMSNASHQSIWPGETGFDMVTNVARQLPWGSDAPRPSSVSSPVGSTPSWAVGGGIGGVNLGAMQTGLA